MLSAREPPWPPILHIMLKMRMGGTWCTRTSLLIMFEKFKKKFSRPNNEEKKLLGECISYIMPLVNASSSTSYLLSYRARPLSNIFRLLTTKSIWCFKLLCEALGLLQDDKVWDMCMQEACIDQDAKRLRNLFVIFLLFYFPLNLKVLWER
jgi:hypothetical protein